MNTISFMTANLVARELNWRMDQGWQQGEKATIASFSPLNTYEERLNALLAGISALGFQAIDLWTAHLHPQWATPGHLEIAKRLLEQHGLRAVSYAGWFAATPAELESACRICRELEIPVLGGGLPLLRTDRAAAVAILRRHGLVFALENHPEPSAGEVLAQLGEGDEDVLGAAVDTGWFATQGADVLQELKALAPRLRHVHLKDVLPKPEKPTGFSFKDMGHETCRLGAGTVPVRECIQFLVSSGYRGALSIEHEPEDFDPGEDCRASRTAVEGWLRGAIKVITPPDPVGVAIVGCGNIADRYASQILTYPHVRLLGAQDIDSSRAEKLTTEFGGKVYASLEEVLADPAVEVVVNLTIQQVHEEIIRKCLQAGKHVHTEKPLTLNSKSAWELVRMAEDKGLRLSSAPTTWLGEAQMTALRKVREGAIGRPRVAYAEVNWGRIESWHPNPAPFYAVGPFYDVSVYPLTLLTSWFGPVESVVAAGGIVYPDRLTKEQKPFQVSSPDWGSAVLSFSSGLRARITASFYVGWQSTQKGLELHGDDGVIRMDRWDCFDSPVYLANSATANQTERVVLDDFPSQGIEFARGLSDLADALRKNRPHKTTGAQAAHVVEIVEALLTSMREGRSIEIAAPRVTFPQELA